MFSNANTQAIIGSDALIPGDIMILYKKDHHLFIHAYVVANSKSGNYNNIVHAAIKPSDHVHIYPPYSAEFCEKMGWEQHAFRINDADIREKFLNILETWATYAIPFDYQRVETAVQKHRELLHSEWEFTKGIFPHMDHIDESVIENDVKEMRSLFDIDQAIKFAARREISPVKPVPESEKGRGFRCLRFVLSALQTAYIMDDVPAINDKWCSLRNNLFSNPVTETLNQQQLSSDEFKAKLTNKIPAELRLSTRYCVPEIFLRSVKHGSTITKLGVLDAPHEADLPEKSKSDELAIEFIKDGVRKKEELRLRICKR